MSQNSFKFQTKQFTIQYSDSVFHFFHPSDLDELINRISDEQALKDKYQPYWIEHWPSSEVFFKYLMELKFTKRLKILEIGCGLGTLSTALLAKGQDVYSIDISPDACKYCHANIVNNDFPPRVFCADLNTLPTMKKFDLIIASDLLYEDRMCGQLLNAFDTLVNSDTRIWIADPCRRGWNLFKSEAQKRYYSFQTLHYHKSKSSVNVEIIELKKLI